MHMMQDGSWMKDEEMVHTMPDGTVMRDMDMPAMTGQGLLALSEDLNSKQKVDEVVYPPAGGLLALPPHTLAGKKGADAHAALVEMEGGVCFAAYRRSEEQCNAAYARVHNKWCYKGFQVRKACQRKNDYAAFKRSQCVQVADRKHRDCRLIRKRKRHRCYQTRNRAHKKCFHTLNRTLEACRQAHEKARVAVANKERGRDRGTGQAKSSLALERAARLTARKCRKKAYRVASGCSRKVNAAVHVCMRKWQVETPSPTFQATPTSPWAPAQEDAVVPEE